jgi:hypothetical protein
LEDFQNVGELTVATLTKFGIPFTGSVEGIASAFETPPGKEALEILSETEMRAYGGALLLMAWPQTSTPTKSS